MAGSENDSPEVETVTNCPTCGMRVRVEGRATQRYIPIDEKGHDIDVADHLETPAPAPRKKPRSNVKVSQRGQVKKRKGSRG